MDATRTERITVNLTPDLLERLDDFADRCRWSRSTAVTVLLERALDDEK
jgi:metal-responsive CopG/Arc/MetJ family transcriptional regulator